MIKKRATKRNSVKKIKGKWASSFPNDIKYNRFGRGGCYTCACCGKRARETGITGGSGYCAACVNRMQLENEHHDRGHKTKVKGCPLCNAKKKK